MITFERFEWMGFVCAAAPVFVVLRLYRWLFGGCGFIYKVGRKPVSRRFEWMKIFL